MVDVAAVADLEEGVPLTVKANGREIVVLKWDGRVYALRNICPHQSASFSAGRARPSVDVCRPANGAVPAGWEIDADDANPVLRCPWHKWEFRMVDGRCATDPRFRVRAYGTTVKDGRVLVDTRAGATTVGGAAVT